MRARSVFDISNGRTGRIVYDWDTVLGNLRGKDNSLIIQYIYITL
jgi:hypothetical protein